MKLQFVRFGKFKSHPCQELFDHYLKLTKKFISIDYLILSEKPSLEKAFEKFLEQKKSAFYLTILDEKGKIFTNQSFALEVEKLQTQGIKEWVILCSGAYGLSLSSKKKAKLLWSLSPMVMTHELAAVIAMEQLFRTFSILNNHPYHHEGS